MSYILVISISVYMSVPFGPTMSATSIYPYPFSNHIDCVIAGVAVKDADSRRNIECITKDEWDKRNLKTNVNANAIGDMHINK